MIRAVNVHKKYGKGENSFEAIRGIDLLIEKGERIAIIGKSGSGKSTLMHLLAALDKPTLGEIYYDDASLSKMNGRGLNTLRNTKIGFIFQQFFLQPQFSSLENITLPLKIQGVGFRERSSRGLQILEEVGMKDKAKNRTVDLSGGQKQRICIARALVTNPQVIFADEPTGNLDSQTGEKIMELLFQLNETKKITLIVVTHDNELAQKFNRIITIQDGRII